MITCVFCGKPATMGSMCLTCHMKSQPTAIVKGWDWMSEDEQIAHLIDSHGYNEDWFDHTDNREDVERHFSEWDVRHDYHSSDHAEHPHGGGAEDKQHEHSLVHQAEVDAAIKSIKEVMSRG